MRTAWLSLVAALLLMSCSGQAPQGTSLRATMARATFDPGRCEQIGPNVYNCHSEHADQRQAEGMHQADSTNDARLIRGQCSDGFKYVQGQGCLPDD
jgi:hypothetical protein